MRLRRRGPPQLESAHSFFCYRAPVPTQAERRASTRAELLDAAAATLSDHGATRFTTTEVVRRAGLSNGALFRHFPTRHSLVAATVEHVLGQLRSDFDAAYAAAGGAGGANLAVRDLLALVWNVMVDPRLAAVYDAYASARTDDALRSAIEPVVRAHLERLAHVGQEVLARLPGVDVELAERASYLAVMAMQGQVVNATVLPEAADGTELLASLERTAEALLATVTTPGAPASHRRSAVKVAPC